MLSLIAFASLSLIFMIKSYTADPLYVRVCVASFPALAILGGVAWAALDDRLSAHPRTRLFYYITWAIVIIPSILFCIAYGNAMTKVDPRLALRQDLSLLSTSAIGINRHVLSSTISSVVTESTAAPIVQISTAEDLRRMDYFLVGNFDPERVPLAEQWLKLATENEFHLVKRFENTLTIGPIDFNYSDMPHDMRYPLPILSLLSRNNAR